MEGKLGCAIGHKEGAFWSTFSLETLKKLIYMTSVNPDVCREI
jgi:hypothetical protein